MIIEQITLTAFQQHTRVVACERTRRAVCVDPGEAADEIVEVLDRLGLELQAVALTHAHVRGTRQRAAVLAKAWA